MSARITSNNESSITDSSAESAQVMEVGQSGSLRKLSCQNAKHVWDSSDALLMAKPCRFHMQDNLTSSPAQ